MVSIVKSVTDVELDDYEQVDSFGSSNLRGARRVDRTSPSRMAGDARIFCRVEGIDVAIIPRRGN